MFRTALFIFIILLPAFSLAAEPESSSLVTSVKFDLPAHSTDAEDGALLGLDECEKLADRTSDIRFTFELTVDPDEKKGSVKRLSEVWLFELSPSGAEMTCDSSSCIPLDSEVTARGKQVVVALDPQTLLQGLGCESSRDVFVRLDLVRDFEDEDDLSSADARVRIDVDGPSAPTIDRSDATDNFIEVDFEGDSDEVERWHVGWGGADVTADAPGQLEVLGSAGMSATRATFEGVRLPVDRMIHVYVWGEDEAGNSGELSQPYAVEPLESIDYWEAYGSSDAACSSTSGSAAWLPLMMLVALFFRRRSASRARLNRCSCARALACTALIVVLMPSPAAAENGFVDVRLGAYSPGIASTDGFSRFFGHDSRWMVGLDGGWIFLNTNVVDIGTDAGVSYTAFSGWAFTETGRSFEDGSTLAVVPVRLGARVFSADWSGWLVLSARGGLTGHYYRFGNPVGVSVADDGTVGEGVQWGWYSSAQIALDLNGFDRTSASAMKSDWAVLKTMVFAEFAYSDVDNFGQSDLDLGDAQLNLGVGFVF